MITFEIFFCEAMKAIKKSSKHKVCVKNETFWWDGYVLLSAQYVFRIDFDREMYFGGVKRIKSVYVRTSKLDNRSKITAIVYVMLGKKN